MRSAADGRPERFPVEADPAVFPKEASPCRWQGAACGRQPKGVEWGDLDLADGLPVVGDAVAVSVKIDLPRTFPGMVQEGTPASNLAYFAPGSGPQGPLALAGVLHRREFCPGEKGGEAVGKTKRGKGTKWMAIVDGNGLPVGFTVASASPSEVKLARQTLHSIPLKRLPERLIGDKAYDSDGLDRQLWKEDFVELIAPNRENRKVKTQDGRKLRRYRRRWKVERFFAWLGNFRRLLIRWEQRVENYLGFLLLACSLIVLRHF